MATTFERTTDRTTDPFGDISPDEKTARRTEWQNLVADVEDLIKKVANIGDVEIARVRERAQKTLAAAKQTAASGARNARVRAHDASVATDAYVREQPWTAVGVAAALGVLIGFIAARR